MAKNKQVTEAQPLIAAEQKATKVKVEQLSKSIQEALVKAKALVAANELKLKDSIKQAVAMIASQAKKEQLLKAKLERIQLDSIKAVNATLANQAKKEAQVLLQLKAKEQAAKLAIIAANEFIKVIEEEIGSVIGVGKLSSDQALIQFQAIRLKRSQNEGKATLSDSEIEALIEERKNARAQKNFKRSDEVRDELLAKGVEIKDSPQGTTWVRK